jgi:hypothetical protein
MFIPPETQLTSFVEVIASSVGQEHFAPVARQGNYVLIGFSEDPSRWSDEFTNVFQQIAGSLARSPAVPFSTAEFEVLEPGTYEIERGKRPSIDPPYSEPYYFRFTRPTKFTATLEHTGSARMSLQFRPNVSDDEQGNLISLKGESAGGGRVQVSVDITEDQMEIIGDRYWRLDVINLDDTNDALATLKVKYDTD